MKPEYIVAQIEDIPSLLGMMARFYAIDQYPFDAAKNRRNLEIFLGNEALGRLWLIRLAGETVGYIVLAYGFSFEYGGRDAFIDEFFIEAPFRSRGLGKATMAFIAAQAEALGVHAIHLEVENHNERGHRLYQGQGFLGKNRAMLTKRIERTR